MNNSDAVFIVTKPLQIMIAMSIRDILSMYINPHLFLINQFINSYETYAKLIVTDRRWSSFTMHSNRAAAFASCAKMRPDILFIDSDISGRTFLKMLLVKLLNPHIKISVYEEGIGTYRTNLYPSSLRSYFARIIGIGTFFGGCIFTNDIWVYNPIEYSKTFPHARCSIHIIKPSLIDFITNNFKFLESIFCSQEIEELIPIHSPYDNCLVYMSDWIIDYSIIERLRAFNGLKILKPHPHIEIDDHNFINNFDVAVPPPRAGRTINNKAIRKIF